MSTKSGSRRIIHFAKKYWIRSSLILLFLFILSTCDILQLSCDCPELILIRSTYITLEWEPPATDFAGTSTEIIFYKVYYRNYGSFHWEEIGEVEKMPHPRIKINHEDIGDGYFEFAIRAFTVMGNQSPLHTSRDLYASPTGGWYVQWIGSN